MDCSTPGFLSFGISQSLLKLMSIELAMPSYHLILCRPLLPPSIFPSIRVFSNESALWIRLNNSFKDAGSVKFSHSVISDSLRPHGLQHARPPWPPLTPRVYSNSCHWVSDAIQPPHPLSSCPQSFLASGSFQMSQLFISGGQSIGDSASTSVLPMNVQDWFPLGWTDWISLQSKGLSRVSSNTTVRKHKFFNTQPSLWSSCHICAWLLEKP